MAWRADGQLLAGLVSDDQLRLWDPGGGMVRAIDTASTLGAGVLASKKGGPSVDLAWSPNLPLLAACKGAATAGIWNVESGDLVATLQRDGAICSLAWSPDGKRIATSGDDCVVHVWDVARIADGGSPRLLATLDGSTDAPVAMTASGHYATPNTEQLRLVVASPLSRDVELVTAVGHMSEVFLRPNLVREALAGKAVAPSPADELASRGWNPTVPWDGAAVVITGS